MKKSVKRLWMILAIVFAAGLIFMAAGYLFGGSIWMHIDRDGIYRGERGHRMQNIEDYNIASFTKIDINADFADVNIVPADKAGIIIEYYNEKPEYSVADGKLQIRSKTKGDTFSFNIGIRSSFRGDRITVYYPRSNAMAETILITDAGNISIDGLNSESLDIRNDFGDLDMSNITSGNMNIKMSSGNIKANDLKFESFICADDYGDAEFINISGGNMQLHMDSGKVSISEGSIDLFDAENEFGDIITNALSANNVNVALSSGTARLNGTFGPSQIENSYGNIEFSTSKSVDVYRYEMTADFGDIRINDQKNGSSVSGGTGQDLLKFDVDSGDIRVKFGK